MRIKELPLSDIHFIPSEYTDHLYHSIIRIGFSFPIKVKETGCGYLCVDGNKRLTALRDILEKDPSYKRGDKVKVIVLIIVRMTVLVEGILINETNRHICIK